MSSSKSKGSKQLQMALANPGTPATAGEIPPQLNTEPTSDKSAPASPAHSVPEEEKRYSMRVRSAPSSPNVGTNKRAKPNTTGSPLKVTHPQIIILMIIKIIIQIIK